MQAGALVATKAGKVAGAVIAADKAAVLAPPRAVFDDGLETRCAGLPRCLLKLSKAAQYC